MTNEELQKKVLFLEREVTELRRKNELMYSESTIPYDVGQAFIKRFGINAMTPASISGKSATSENRSVNEGGSSTYFVLNPPDIFLQITLSGTVYYLPAWTS